MESNAVAVKENTAGITGNTIGERLKSARRRMKYSQELVASASDINISNITLGYYERDERMVPEELLHEFAVLYQCEVSDLATEEDILKIRKYYENPHVLGGIVSRKDRGNKGKRRKKKKNAETQPKQKDIAAVDAAQGGGLQAGSAAENNGAGAGTGPDAVMPAPVSADISADCAVHDEVRELAKKVNDP